jgi:hypothetical protein
MKHAPQQLRPGRGAHLAARVLDRHAELGEEGRQLVPAGAGQQQRGPQPGSGHRCQHRGVHEQGRRGRHRRRHRLLGARAGRVEIGVDRTGLEPRRGLPRHLDRGGGRAEAQHDPGAGHRSGRRRSPAQPGHRPAGGRVGVEPGDWLPGGDQVRSVP